MHEFERLIGEWEGEGELPTDPPMRIRTWATVERLGKFLVFRSSGEPAEVPDNLSIIGGAPEGEPQPMHYFDDRGVQREYLMTLEGSHVDDLARARLRLERPARPRLQPALHRRAVRGRQHDRRPLGTWPGRRRRRMGARLPADLPRA